MTTQEWEPHRESFRATVMRNITIAIVAGAIASRAWGGLSRWPLAAVLMLWPTFGGHFIELWFLNWLRPRLPRARGVQMLSRFAVWFIGGVLLAMGMWLTSTLLIGRHPLPAMIWWPAGFVFIGIEIVAQSALHLRGRPSFFNGRA